MDIERIKAHVKVRIEQLELRKAELGYSGAQADVIRFALDKALEELSVIWDMLNK